MTSSNRTRSLRAAAVMAACGLAAGCSSQPATAPSQDSASSTPASIGVSSPTPSPTPMAERCRAMAETLPVEQQAGQLFMVGVSTSGLSTPARTAIQEGHIGAAVLLDTSQAGTKTIRQITAELGTLGIEGVPMLVAVDQEGGAVQRLTGPGFSDIPTAVEQGRLSPEELRAEAGMWGQELANAGIHYNLAPVADVVPPEKQSSNAPIGQLERHFATDSDSASQSVTAFVEGMNDAGILTSLKHFPGLGEVTVNTDYGVAVDNTVTADEQYLAPFTSGIDAGADSVMLSSAIFTQIDPNHEGVFSRVIVTDLLRSQLGFKGVAISDDLGAAVAVGGVDPGQRAVQFFAAGGDLVINADPALMPAMVEATLAWAAEDPANAEHVTTAAGRVLELKEKANLVTCS